MGLDSGVQQVLKTGVGTVGFLSFATALWVRGGIYFAEARVFVRGSKPEIKGMVETLLVEAVEADAAIDALERLVLSWIGPSVRANLCNGVQGPCSEAR